MGRTIEGSFGPHPQDVLQCVHQVLNLSADGSLETLSLVHLIPLLAGARRCCRLVIETSSVPMLRAALNGAGFCCVETYIENYELGTDWWGFNRVQSKSALTMLSLSSTRESAELLTTVELDGDHVAAGRLLGYPECCVRSYDQVAASAGNWPNYYLSRSTVVSSWCNRLTCVRGDCCPTGYLFPCSLTCPAAIEYGRTNMRAIAEFGLERLVDAILEAARVPLFFQDGKVLVQSMLEGARLATPLEIQ